MICTAEATGLMPNPPHAFNVFRRSIAVIETSQCLTDRLWQISKKSFERIIDVHHANRLHGSLPVYGSPLSGVIKKEGVGREQGKRKHPPFSWLQLI